ncbi:helix-turn-helix domain-containing protein [Jeotgalibacillus sp. ET6]|uniref:helix-turn-helix domain-containing protein n=1 Tax=Jeotgalibacillus sp. ET6 TaxID=3037260 RepID=UPI00241835FF|nr:helix-turn-helix domain-containing protein [Jeotgalibacillus sp. ET6]MDG5471489.1 helix-turn-helix domain-containing protein [Jeotgalibacillus sp. ET6]
MKNTNIDLILHPVRLRIIQHLSREPATVQQLKEWMADIPQATLYRHLTILKKDSLIYVVEEKKIRGAIERTFALEKEKPLLSAEELKKMSGEEHLKMFMKFLSNVTGQTKSYLLSNPDLEKDPFGYNQLELHLTASEVEELQKGMNDLLSKFTSSKPSAENQKVTLIQMLVPDPNETKGRDHT